MTFTFKIKLKGSRKPPIWRKVKINSNATFHELHRLIMVVFNWTDMHLHQFSPDGWGSYPRLEKKDEDSIDQEEFDSSDYWPTAGNYDSEKIKLNQYFKSVGATMVHIYDYGDDWQHIIELKKIDEEDIARPEIISGKGKAPPEDCGGIPMYYEMVKAINNADYPRHEYHRDYQFIHSGKEWDVNEFDKKKIEEELLQEWE